MGDIRISQAKGIQKTVEEFGDAVLGSTSSKKMSAWVMSRQGWIRQTCSSLLIPFFLYPNPSQQPEEEAACLRVILYKLLDKYILPSVKKSVEECVDPSVLSQTLVKSLARVRKEWTAFTISSKFLLSPLEHDTNKASNSSVERIFRFTFQESVFSVFRSKLVFSLLDLVKQVREDPSKLRSISGDAAELIKQFFDDLDTNGDGDNNSSNNNNAATLDDVTAVNKKLADFHATVIEPFKKSMKEQYLKVAQEFEMQNDLPGLLAWIPAARKAEIELIRGLFHNVYPADFDLLCNNIIYEFDSQVATVNALRLVSHNQFGVKHIFATLPLDRASLSWKIDSSLEANTKDSSSSSQQTQEASATASAASSSNNSDPAVLVARLRDLYVVVSTAQQAFTMPINIRTLPKSTTSRHFSVASSALAAAAASKKAATETIEAFDYFKKSCYEHGESAIKAIVDSLRTSQQFASDKEYCHTLCKTIGSMLNRKNDIVKNLCDNNPDVLRSYYNAFKEYVNNTDPEPTFTRKRGEKGEVRKQRYPDIVAHYVDFALTKNDNDDNIDNMADIAVEILSFISDKDIFVEVYRHAIARRLLTREFTDKLSSNEEIVLSRLKSILPANVVRKCGQGMMEDLSSSNNLIALFQQSPLYNMDDGALTFVPRVLGTMNWPQTKGPQGNVIWNHSLVEAQNTFERWYQSKNKNRILRWQPERGNSVMKLAFPKSVKEVTMSIIQANLLVLLDAKASTPEFAAKGGLTSTELVTETGYKLEDVECILMSMIGVGKGHPAVVRITGPGSATKKFDSTNDRFGMNPDFAAKMKKFGLPPPPTKSGHDDSDTPTDAAIIGWRTTQAQAVIVRIMKSKHVLDNETLIRTSIEHLERSFKAQPQFLKKCIQDLISKEYLERDEEDMSLYKYRA